MGTFFACFLLLALRRWPVVMRFLAFSCVVFCCFVFSLLVVFRGVVSRVPLLSSWLLDYLPSFFNITFFPIPALMLFTHWTLVCLCDRAGLFCLRLSHATLLPGSRDGRSASRFVVYKHFELVFLVLSHGAFAVSGSTF